MLDLLPRTAGRPRRTTPYVVLGGGLYRHTQQFPAGRYTSTEGAFTAGVGLRTWANERVSVAADARPGWEPHIRVAALIGMARK